MQQEHATHERCSKCGQRVPREIPVTVPASIYEAISDEMDTFNKAAVRLEHESEDSYWYASVS